jgi:hypothetical protein
MTWRGIVGKSFTPDAFEKYVGTLKFGLWRPRFIVVHNTSAPDLKTWQGWQARKPPITDEKWAQNLVGYYRDQQGWSAGPHLFITPGGILAFSPLTGPGTHSPSWNSISLGHRDRRRVRARAVHGPVRDNLIAALAILHVAAGLQPLPYELGVRGLHFHKEDPVTTHKTAPGEHGQGRSGRRGAGEDTGAMSAGDHQPEDRQAGPDRARRQGQYRRPQRSHRRQRKKRRGPIPEEGRCRSRSSVRPRTARRLGRPATAGRQGLHRAAAHTGTAGRLNTSRVPGDG